MTEKTLTKTDIDGARELVSDIKVFGDGDMFKLLCKASSQAEGWMKSTKACEIPGVGCLVQVTTQQRNPDGSYAVAEALSFVPGVTIAEMRGQINPGGPYVVTGRGLMGFDRCMQKAAICEAGRLASDTPDSPTNKFERR